MVAYLHIESVGLTTEVADLVLVIFHPRKLAGHLILFHVSGSKANMDILCPLLHDKK